MSLSYAPLCFRFTAIRPKITNKANAKSPFLSSQCSLVGFSNNYLDHPQGLSKRRPDNYYRWRTANPISAYNRDGSTDLSSPFEKSLRLIKYAFQFMRPKPLIGVFIQFCCIVAKTWMHKSHVIQSSIASIVIKAIAAFVSASFAYGFCNGINEIFDLEMDKVNKPYLPLSTGDLSIKTAWILTVSFAVIGLLLARIINYGPLLVGISGLLFMGYAYNLPPFTLKYSTFGAIFSNGVCQGFFTLLCTHSAAKAALGLPFEISSYDAFMFTFVTVIGFIGGFMKDLMDLEGDMVSNVPTLVSKLGLRKTTYLGVALMTMNYIGGILASISMPQAFKRIVIIPIHLLIPVGMILQVGKLENANYTKEARVAFHQFLFSLILMAYLVYILM